MKLVSMIVHEQPRIGILQGDQLSVLSPGTFDLPTSVGELVVNEAAIETIRALTAENLAACETVAWSDVRVLPPVINPQKVICIGKNYADHAREMGGEPPEIPVVFNMFPSAIIGPQEAIRIPAISEQVDFEAELVVVIGKPGKQIAREQAMEHVFGYCCGNDITARDWQKGKPGGQWLLGKTFDTFAPLGPFIATSDEVADPHNLDIQLRLNGQLMQDSNTRQLIFPIDVLIAHLSKFVTFSAGDLIFTGTPPGVGAGRTPPVFLKPGDHVEVEIEGLGVLESPVIADS